MSYTRLNVTELDFDQIKLNLKSYFQRSNSKFKDWDFEGSGLSTFVDVLAYNTHYNAMLAHAAMNETFIDSAQLRANVVSRAHLLGYTPKSITAPRAELDIIFSFGESATSYVGPIEITRGSTFSTTYNEKPYTYTVLGTQVATITPAGTYEFTQDAEKALTIAEGVMETATYTVDNAVPRQYFEIKSRNADLSTLRVTVRENSTSVNGGITYNAFSSLSGVTSDSQIYFIDERADGIYRIYFGDGYYGQKLGNLDVVTLEYIVTSGEESNGASVFTFASSIAAIPSGLSPLSITTLSVSSGGAPEESIESIRYNAPRSLQTQNRAVTAEDYITLIGQARNDLETITVWGGDQEVLPDETNSAGNQIHAGKVYISAKPFADFSYNAEAKSEILSLIDTRRVITTKPVFVDPDYVYLALKVFFEYDYRATALTYNELEALVRSTVIGYTDDVLEKFTGVFRHSKMLANIDSCSPAIMNSAVVINLYKYTPDTVSLRNPEITDVKLDYSTPLYGDFSYDLTSESTIFSDETYALAPKRVDTGTVSRTGMILTVDAVAHPYDVNNDVNLSGSSIVEYNADYSIASVATDSFTVALSPKLSTPITGLTRVGSVVTATTSGNHTYVNASLVTISGCANVEYNGEVVITGVTANTFTYDITTTPTTPGGTATVTGVPAVTTISLVRSGSVVTATTVATHAYSIGNLVYVSGCSVGAYNGDWTITGVTSNTFTYTIGTTPAVGPHAATVTKVPAAGPVAVTLTGAPITLQSIRAMRVAGAAGDLYPVFVYTRNSSTGAYEKTRYEFDSESGENGFSTIASGYPIWPIGKVDVATGIMYISADDAQTMSDSLGYVDLESIDPTNLAKLDNAYFYGKFIADKILLAGDSGTEFKVWARPAGDIIAPKRNILLTADITELAVSGAIDTVVTGGSAGATKFVTFNRE